MTANYQLNDLVFKYGLHRVLDIDSAIFEQGKNLAIHGANGSGKTTLLNLLSFIEFPQTGQVIFSDQHVDSDNALALRENISYVQQKPYLFNLSVFENIALPLKLRGVGKRVRREQTNSIIEKLSIQNLTQRNAHDLSGGETQKVAIARALVNDPEVLILDEPFSHLDRNTQEYIELLLLDLKNDPERMVIFTLHDHLKAHLLADEVFTLIDGQLLNSGVMNLFQGKINTEHSQFDTGKIAISLPEQCKTGQFIAVDANQLVLSIERLSSSMRNEFQGKVSALHDQSGQVRITINAGETFEAIITHGAMKDLAIHPGDTVWVYFKSSSIKIM